jgi:hypothetical protein
MRTAAPAVGAPALSVTADNRTKFLTSMAIGCSRFCGGDGLSVATHPRPAHLLRRPSLLEYAFSGYCVGSTGTTTA